MNSAPYSADLMVTGRCNLRCPFCWGPSHSVGGVLPVEEWTRLIGRLATLGTRTIILTGGEPLLYDGLPAICHCAKNLGLRVILSTNGILLESRGIAVLPLLDEIGIPLDGSSAQRNNALRPQVSSENHYAGALAAIEYLHRNWPAIKLTIRTVVTAENADDIEAIGERLLTLPTKMFRWKLYQFVPRGYGAETAESLAINTDDFKAVAAEVSQRLPSLMIDSLCHEQIDGRYLFVEPDGAVVVPLGSHITHRLGNVTTDFEEVMEKLRFFIVDTRNRQRGYAGFRPTIEQRAAVGKS
jgi:MoaA/NifB/PqqE/SkfB family radical SAM enzyme